MNKYYAVITIGGGRTTTHHTRRAAEMHAITAAALDGKQHRVIEIDKGDN